MNKKYLVRLTAQEREALREIVQKLKGSSQKVRRAQMLPSPEKILGGQQEADLICDAVGFAAAG